MASLAPVIIKNLPNLVTFEGAPFGPIDLKLYIHSPEGGGALRFSGQLKDGRAFPQGMICTQNGLISGIAASGTIGEYELVISAENDSGVPLNVEAFLSIKNRLSIDDPNFLTNLKSQVWQALGTNLPMTELNDIWDRPITAVEVYYLFQRFAVLTVWDVFNLETPSTKTLLNLAGTSKHFNIYDRGSCLVAAPKDLFSHERTLEDALQTARVLARETYKRGWTIEFAGFNKMVRSAWVELQHLGDKHGKKLEILHFQPTMDDLKVYVAQAQNQAPTPS